jgi:hypothetical protein
LLRPDVNSGAFITELLVKKDDIERIISLDRAVEIMSLNGFTNIDIETICVHVWKGLDTWMAQSAKFRDSWGRNWFRAYQKQLIDFYIISAKNFGVAPCDTHYR